MDSLLAQNIESLMKSDAFWEEFERNRALEFAAAPKCFWCGDRCDEPFGNGLKCRMCLSRPTAEDYRTIVY